MTVLGAGNLQSSSSRGQVGGLCFQYGISNYAYK